MNDYLVIALFSLFIIAVTIWIFLDSEKREKRIDSTMKNLVEKGGTVWVKVGDKWHPILPKEKELTDEQIASVCFSMRHDFGLMSQEERVQMITEARSWEHAFRKERELANRNRND